MSSFGIAESNFEIDDCEYINEIINPPIVVYKYAETDDNIKCEKVCCMTSIACDTSTDKLAYKIIERNNGSQYLEIVLGWPIEILKQQVFLGMQLTKYHPLRASHESCLENLLVKNRNEKHVFHVCIDMPCRVISSPDEILDKKVVKKKNGNLFIRLLIKAEPKAFYDAEDAWKLSVSKEK